MGPPKTELRFWKGGGGGMVVVVVVVGGGGGDVVESFFLECEDLGAWFDDSMPACAFFFFF